MRESATFPPVVGSRFFFVPGSMSTNFEPNVMVAGFGRIVTRARTSMFGSAEPAKSGENPALCRNCDHAVERVARSPAFNG